MCVFCPPLLAREELLPAKAAVNHITSELQSCFPCGKLVQSLRNEGSTEGLPPARDQLYRAPHFGWDREAALFLNLEEHSKL